MFKGRIINPTPVALDTNIPFSVVWNTNANTRYDSASNAIDILSTGYYDVAVNLVVTDIAVSPASAQLFANDEPIAESVTQSDITATTGTASLTIVDTVRVLPTDSFSFAELAVRLGSAGTVLSGVITVEKRK